MATVSTVSGLCLCIHSTFSLAFCHCLYSTFLDQTPPLRHRRTTGLQVLLEAAICKTLLRGGGSDDRQMTFNLWPVDQPTHTHRHTHLTWGPGNCECLVFVSVETDRMSSFSAPARRCPSSSFSGGRLLWASLTFDLVDSCTKKKSALRQQLYQLLILQFFFILWLPSLKTKRNHNKQHFAGKENQSGLQMTITVSADQSAVCLRD